MIDERYTWSRKGKKYRTKYLGALKDLLGGPLDAKEGTSEKAAIGRARTNHARQLANKIKHKI